MIPPEHIATMREALQTWSEMLERRANTVERHGVAGTTYRKHIAEIDAALAYLDTLPTALDAANQRVQELEASFDLRHDSDMRAIKQWQEATGEELKWPNHADLCVWLMQRIAELEAQAEWEPVGGGFNSGRLGRFEIQVGITDDRTMYVFNINQNRKCWPVVLPDNIRLCRRKEGR